MIVLKFIALSHKFIRNAYDRLLMYCYKRLFYSCGKNVVFSPTKSEFDYKNISIGEKVYIGPGALFVSTLSHIYIGDKVMFGPNVSLLGGNHSTHIIGKFMADYSLKDKRDDDDDDILIDKDVWVGTGSIILKGVKVGRGAIVAAGSVVNKNVPPYSIVGGTPAKVLKYRWEVESILEHEKLVYPSDLRYTEEYLKEFR